jgi:hypothetical protein
LIMSTAFERMSADLLGKGLCCFEGTISLSLVTYQHWRQ